MNIVGSIVALVTPMDKNGNILESEIDNLINYHLDNNTDGIVLFGTTGEGYAVELDEQERIFNRVKNRVGNKIPIIVGTGSNSTKKTIEQTRQAASWGSDAALVVTPYYNRPSQQGLEVHYKSVANAVDLPIILYNVPGRTACDLQPETTALLAQEQNIVAIKEAVPDEVRLKKLVELCPSDFNLLSGDDATFLDFYKLGAHGVISVSCNVVPKQMAQICNFAKDKNWDECDSINRKLELLHKNLFVCSNPIPVKWALYYLGLISSPDCRLPLLAMPDQYQGEVMKALELAELKK